MKFLVRGRRKLEGAVNVRGAKNAATKMMVASLLTREPLILENFPFIGDTDVTGELCRTFGTTLTPDLKRSSLVLQTAEIIQHEAPRFSRRNRIPILALGPLLARVGKARVPIVGGDKIGPRPVDLHMDALRALGAVIEESSEGYEAEAPKGLSGANIHFKFPSVGATENAILAAVLARGHTVIRNAAVEPEITDLIKLLQKMGAIIGLGADRTVYIDGVQRLRGATHRILPDRNEAVSFAILAVATDGNVMVRGTRQDDLVTFLNILRKIGGGFEVQDEGIRFFKEREFASVEVETDTHPGFMTDWQQPTVVLLTQAQGVSVVHETIYEDRFGYAEDLNRMGARITVFSKCLGEIPCRFSGMGCKHSAVVHGPTALSGTTLHVRDLRSGMAHVVAALVADGESVIEGIEEIDRGYEDLDGRLRALGADIERRSE